MINETLRDTSLETRSPAAILAMTPAIAVVEFAHDLTAVIGFLYFSLGNLVGARGFEPPTSRSQTERTTRLCYAPNVEFSRLTAGAAF